MTVRPASPKRDTGYPGYQTAIERRLLTCGAMLNIIEVGACDGSDTLRLSDRGQNRLFSFEPNPEMIPKIQEKLIRCENFHLTAMAVDIDEGWRWFNISDGGQGASSLYQFDSGTAAKWDAASFKHLARYRVRTIRLDTFMRENNIEHVDYLWIDAQGNDFRVLQSLGERLVDVKEGKCEAAYTASL